MTEAKIDEVIKRYTDNAEYVRQRGDLEGCMEYRELAEFLEDCKKLLITCDDAVSREAIIAKAKDEAEGMDEPFKSNFAVLVEGLLDKLPSVTPTRPKGKWIAQENEEMQIVGYYCSNCDMPMETENKTRFCPNCGADMRGGE